LSAAADGGSDAAHKLSADIKEYINQKYQSANHWSIMVQIYANVEGLSKKLCSVGLITSPSDFRSFTVSFSMNQPLFSFIDVGSGKERADYKIK
jgi:hypothetical protein